MLRLKALIPQSLKILMKRLLRKGGIASPYTTPEVLAGHFKPRGFRAILDEKGFVYRPPEVQVAEFMAENIWRGDTCVDVGAHFGYYTLLMALYAGDSGRVYSFEPQDEARSILHKNVSINGLQEQVEVLSLVVTDESGEVPWQGELFSTTSRIGQVQGKQQTS